jgi:hypothetical protein
MGILDRLKGNTKEYQQVDITNFSQEDEEETSLEPEPEDSLNLGWYFSQNEQKFQMAKIAEKDRATHFYVVGASGSGKTKFLEFLIQQDIKKDAGFAVIDPHGDLIEDIKDFLAANLNNSELSDRVILIDPTDPRYTVAFNPLEKLAQTSSAEQASELVSSFRKIWPDAWGPRMEEVLRNSLIALGEAEFTLPDLPLFLTNEGVRTRVLAKVSHPIVRQYFERFDSLTDRGRNVWIEPVLNKVNAFLADDRIRQMLCFPKSSFNLRDIMDNQKILLIKLDKGKLKGNGDLLGSLLMAKIQMAAFSRSDIPQPRRVPFYLYIDEFQNYAADSFSVVLSEARKYGLSLILAHQTLSQVSSELRSLILGNCGIQVYFRVARKDAELLAKEGFEYSGYNIKSVSLTLSHSYYKFWTLGEEWEHNIEELQNLSPRSCYVKHKIQGGMIAIRTVDVSSPDFYLENYLFGKRYLLEREEIEREYQARLNEILESKHISKSEEEKKAKEEKKQPKKQPRTLEEIIASMEPIEEAMLYSIGIGNYLSGEIYQAANERLKEKGISTQDYSQYKDRFYALSKKPPEGKGLTEFTKRGRSFCYWLSKWGEIAFAEKFGKPSDRAINELGGGGLLPRAISLELIKNWLEPEGYKVSKEDEIETDLTESHRGYTDLIAEKGGKVLRIEIEHRSSKEQIEKNIRKNLEYSDVVYEIASDETAKKKVIQVALKVMFRLRKEKPDKDLTVKIASIDELKQSQFKDWFEVKN